MKKKIYFGTYELFLWGNSKQNKIVPNKSGSSTTPAYFVARATQNDSFIWRHLLLIT